MMRFSNLILLSLLVSVNYGNSLDSLTWKSLIPPYLEQAFQELSEMSLEEIENKIFKGVSNPCQTDTLSWILPFLDSADQPGMVKPWMFSLLDSWGKPSSGMLNDEWRKQALGDFDQCLNIQRNDSDESSTFGKYCISIVHIKNGTSVNETVEPTTTLSPLGELEFQVPFLFGSCLSNTCSKDDASILFENTLETLSSFNIGLRVLDCFTQDENALDAWDILMLAVMGFLVFMSFITYSCDSGRSTRSSLGTRLFASFSLKRNINSWLNTNASSELSAVSGILFLSVAWIILSHSWEIPFLSYSYPFQEIRDLAPRPDYSDWSQLLVRNGFIASDTLLTICGLTITYNLIKELDRSNGKGTLYFYIQIILRFTPVYILVIGFMATLYVFLADGPFSGFMYHASRNCESNGWKNMLYVNNLVNATMENMCLPDSWYFGVEMQFLILSPILIYILWKNSKIGLGLLGLLLIGSIAAPIVLTYIDKLLPTTIPTRSYEDYFTEFYILPWNRASPFLVGMGSGYILRATGKGFKLSKALVLVGWLLSTAVALSIVLGLFPYHDPAETIPRVEATIYAGLHRFAWGVVISWIIFACSRNYGGWIEDFLTWKFFEPLGRVSIVAFLIALPVQFVHHFRFQQALAPDTYTKINLFLADLVITYFVAILLNLFLGFPCAEIARLFRPPEKEEEDNGLEMLPRSERFGIYYNGWLSDNLSKDELKGRRRKNKGPFRPNRQRYGIYYDQHVSISMESIK